MLNSTIVLLTCVLLLFTPLIAIDFSWEFLRFDVNRDWIDTYGEYHLTNCRENAPPTKLLFPFAANGALGTPQKIEIFSLDGKSIDWKWVKQDTLLSIACPQNPCGFCIRYRTPIPKNKFIYILHSTRAWGEPLDSCKIEVRYPISISIATNYSADTIITSDSIAVAKFKFKNFMPSQDFIITISNDGF